MTRLAALLSVSAALVAQDAAALCQSANCICYWGAAAAAEVTMLGGGEGGSRARVERISAGATAIVGEELVVEVPMPVPDGSRRFAIALGSSWRDVAAITDGAVSCDRGEALGPFTMPVDDALAAAVSSDCTSLTDAAGFREPECRDNGGPFGCSMSGAPSLLLVGLGALVRKARQRTRAA